MEHSSKNLVEWNTHQRRPLYELEENEMRALGQLPKKQKLVRAKLQTRQWQEGKEPFLSEWCTTKWRRKA